MKITKRKLLLLIIGLLVITAIPATLYLVKRRQEIRKRAAPTTELSFFPEERTVDVGEEFSLAVKADTVENTISAVELYIVFDPEKLEYKSIEPSDWLPNLLVPGRASGGVAMITVGSPMDEPRKGEGTVAIVTFKALAPAEKTEIKFGDNTIVPDISEEVNVLEKTTPAVITILAAEPTPAPECTLEFTVVGPTSTPTLTPTATPTGTTTPKPTSTPTATPTATGVPKPTVTPKPKPTATPAQVVEGPTPTPVTLPEVGIVSPTWLIILGGVGLLLVGFLFAF